MELCLANILVVSLLFLSNRFDHCNHAEGSICAWMPLEPRSGSACKCNFVTLIINTYVLKEKANRYQIYGLVDFQQREMAHKRVARSDSDSDSASSEVNVFFVF